MKTNPMELLKKSYLSLELTPISIRELLFIPTAPCEIYGLDKGVFEKIIGKGSLINRDLLKHLIEQNRHHLFIPLPQHQKLIENLQEILLSETRSLSINKSVEKVKKQMNLLTINMAYLYDNPKNDDTLKLQHKCAKTLAYYLMSHMDIHNPLYKEYIKQKHHFIYAQPLISSFFVLGLLKNIGLYADNDIEQFFVCSYFKDIGMSSIPIEKYDQEELSDQEKDLLRNHPENSITILKGRIPFSPNHLEIIKNHHSFSLLSKELSTQIIGPGQRGIISGFETLVITVMDVISAMINGRPYRAPNKLFEALDLIKILIGHQYPQEFRLIVSYFKKYFFSK